jgi:uncharacterized membrane protein YheB (UPF0754 family)
MSFVQLEKMTKGHITLIATGLIMPLAFFFHGHMRDFIFTLGVSGVVGCATNAIAIRMLFDHIYLLPWLKKWPLPYSGILEEQREEIAKAIGWTVAKRLLSTDALMRAVTAEPFQEVIRSTLGSRLREILCEPGFLEVVSQDIGKHACAFIGSDLFRLKLQQALYRHLGWVGSILVEVKNVRERDKITTQMQRELKQVVAYMCQDESFRLAVRDFLKNLPIKFYDTQTPLKEGVQRCIAVLVRDLLEQVDIEKIVADEVRSFPPGALSSIIIKITAENLDWLEVWGGVLGVLVGGLFWCLGKLV